MTADPQRTPARELLPPLVTARLHARLPERAPSPAGPFFTAGDRHERVSPAAALQTPAASDSPDADELPLLVPWLADPSVETQSTEATSNDELVLEPVHPLGEPQAADAVWGDELEMPTLGEAEPEDEQPFDEPRDPWAEAPESSAALAFPADVSELARSLPADPQQAADVAERLERIARTLREHGPAAAMAEHGTDPLGAMITGFLLGSAKAGDR